MLLKQRAKSSKQLMLEMIERRLSKSHAKYTYFHEQLNRTQAGFAGEQRVDQQWLDMHIKHKHFILHDVELINDRGFSHQMDTLFICQYFICIIEIKNIVGQVEYMEDNHQFIRITANGRVDGFKNPFDQVKRHARFLRQLFHDINVNIPIVYMIVTSNLLAKPIIHVSGLAEKIEQLFQRYQQICMDEKSLQQCAHYVLAMHRPTQWVPDVEMDDVRKGVLCSQCNFQHVMHYHLGKWHCEACGWNDRDSMLAALHDYRLVVGNTVSNGEFRDFFGIPSDKVAYYLLKHLKFEVIGANKNRRYIIPESMLDY
ncbi:nuclease-related domain-containing protein [Lysinibacillus sphaericus]|uniref:nuclease-related domain-containing protein n=1 Tax=Lysinibacillus sphaericus TaxID=1421 RepID=UPI003F7A4F01